MDPDARRRLRPVVDAARSVLDDLEPDEVPVRLRAIARSSARRLPPPFERSVIDAITHDEGFRRAVAAAWRESGRSDTVVDAFLDDPSGLDDLVRDVSAHERARRLERELEAAGRRIDELERELAVAKSRITEERRSAAEERRSVRAEVKRAREGLERELKSARREAADASTRADDAAAESEALRAQIEEQRSRSERAAQRRAKRGETPATAMRAAPIPTGDPMTMAAWIDGVERVLRPYRRRADGATVDQSDGRIRLPAGIAPDRAEGIAALADLAPARVLVDGYNLASAAGIVEFGSHTGRSEALRLAHILSRLVAGDVIVVFDAIGGEGRRSFVTELGVDVRFAHDRTADDLIVSLIEADRRCAVVTNDRELRDRSANRGALTLWSDALVEWANA